MRKILFGLLASVATIALGKEFLSPEAFLQTSRTSLSPSTWPLDHGDSARSKFVMNAGLPANVTSENMKSIANPYLIGAQWLYTQGEKSEYLFAMGGRSGAYYVAKLNSTSLDVLQRYEINRGAYIGGMLMHKNGHVYTVHTNYLYVFWNGDLNNVTVKELPTELNNKVIMTNGMLVTQDGYLVIKQWPFQVTDIFFVMSGVSYVFKILIACFVISFGVVYQFVIQPALKITDPTKRINNSIYIFFLILKALILLAIFTVVSFFTVYCIGLARKTGAYNPFRFFADSLLSPVEGGGELKLIDPITLEIIAAATLPERCSMARMALSSVQNKDGQEEDAILLLGDENIHQYRWRIQSKELFWIPSWSRNYRKKGDGTFPGTGPSIYNGLVYFTDNTFPVSLGRDTYTMYSLPIHGLLNTTTDEIKPLLPSKHYTPAADVPFVPSSSWKHYLKMPRYRFPRADGEKIITFPSETNPADRPSGFMIWSVTISPALTEEASTQEEQAAAAGGGHAIVWDTGRSVVQARRLEDISEIVWEIQSIRQGDCITIVPDRQHMYMTDYSYAPSAQEVSKWMGAASGDDTTYATVTKYFYVVNTLTGQIMVNYTIPDATGINLSLLVPGANQDVFVGTRTGIVRVFVP